jgi:hypothetical protein
VEVSKEDVLRGFLRALRPLPQKERYMDRDIEYFSLIIKSTFADCN